MVSIVWFYERRAGALTLMYYKEIFVSKYLLNKKLLSLFLVAVMISACSGGKADRIASHMSKANDYMESGNYEKARVEYSNVLQMDQKNVAAMFGRAQVQEKLGKLARRRYCIQTSY